MATTKKTAAHGKTPSKDKDLPKVDDMTILINCMDPCTPCDVLAKKCVTKPFRTWAALNKLDVVYSNDNKNVVGYWKRYGKPNKVEQATPQVYVVGKAQACAGVQLHAGARVGDYIVPDYDKWDAKMLEEVCSALMVDIGLTVR